MNRKERPKGTGWRRPLHPAIALLLLILILIVGGNYVPSEFRPAIRPAATLIMMAYMLWWLLWGIAERSGRAVGYASSGLALGSVLLLYHYGLLEDISFTVLSFASIGIGWLIERLIQRMWERHESS